jgi:prepilin-type N-terminal cleavage/methylation domain-containing protein
MYMKNLFKPKRNLTANYILLSGQRSTSIKNGFTLLELMVASFIFSTVVGIAAIFFAYFFKNYNFNFSENQSVEATRSSVVKLMSELREARISEDGAYPLQTANDQEIKFYADVDNDGVVELVRYYMEGANLKRGVIKATGSPSIYDPATETVTTISTYIQNGVQPVFYYYNGDWPGDTTNNPLVAGVRLLNTRLVKIRLLVNTDTKQQSNIDISNEIMIRNLKTN